MRQDWICPAENCRSHEGRSKYWLSAEKPKRARNANVWLVIPPWRHQLLFTSTRSFLAMTRVREGFHNYEQVSQNISWLVFLSKPNGKFSQQLGVEHDFSPKAFQSSLIGRRMLSGAADSLKSHIKEQKQQSSDEGGFCPSEECLSPTAGQRWWWWWY